MLLVIVVIFAAFGALWYNRFAIYDYLRLFNYSPPSTVVSLATEDTMTPYARHLFYVYHPQIEGSAAFNTNCKVTDQAIVLGCTIIGNGIYLYNVTDPQLSGVEQATAAYEMLHVAYSRLSSSERSYIDGMVQTVYNENAASDPIIKAEVASYLQTEGSAALPNELHSVVGTEIANLPPALNSYYAKYFNDRSTVVKYTDQYEGVLNQREQAVTTDDQTLSSMKQEINSDEATLNYDYQQINQETSTMNSERSAGNESAYNESVPGYNSQVDSYNNLLNQTNNLIAQYNQLVSSRNSVAVSEDQLIQSLSSSPSTIPSN